MIPETVLVTFFSNVSGNTCRRQILTPDELLQRIRTASAPTKEALPWLKMGAFGDVRSDKGSLRHDRNLNEISGVEIDYDAEQITFDEAIEILVKANVTSIVYTSPSHMREGHGPRWRVLGLLRQHRSPGQRDHLVNRLAGLFRNGAATAISAESWNKSQAYFFGSVDHNPEHRAELIEGDGLDDLDDLDLI